MHQESVLLVKRRKMGCICPFQSWLSCYKNWQVLKEEEEKSRWRLEKGLEEADRKERGLGVREEEGDEAEEGTERLSSVKEEPTVH